MPDRPKAPDEQPDSRQDADQEAGGNSIEDASDEAVRFMDEGEEPGHAGRGDAG